MISGKQSSNESAVASSPHCSTGRACRPRLPGLPIYDVFCFHVEALGEYTTNSHAELDVAIL